VRSKSSASKENKLLEEFSATVEGKNMFKPKIWSERFLETSNGHGIRGFAPSGAQYFTPVA
jgi:hypothetical protein